MTIREYGSRTAATNFLRSKGIAAADFAKFLSAKGDKFLVNDALIGAPKVDPVKEVVMKSGTAESVEKVKLPLATNVVVIGTDLKSHLEVSTAETTPAKRSAAKPKRQSVKEMHFASAAKAAGGKATKDAKPVPNRRSTDKPLPVSQRCLELFKAGRDNAAVWAVLQAEYGMDEDKAHYPSWYRSHFRRKGILPAASAVAKGKK